MNSKVAFLIIRDFFRIVYRFGLGGENFERFLGERAFNLPSAVRALRNMIVFHARFFLVVVLLGFRLRSLFRRGLCRFRRACVFLFRFFFRCGFKSGFGFGPRFFRGSRSGFFFRFFDCFGRFDRSFFGDGNGFCFFLFDLDYLFGRGFRLFFRG